MRQNFNLATLDVNLHPNFNYKSDIFPPKMWPCITHSAVLLPRRSLSAWLICPSFSFFGRGGGHDFVGGIMRGSSLVPVAQNIFMDVGDSLNNAAQERRPKLYIWNNFISLENVIQPLENSTICSQTVYTGLPHPVRFPGRRCEKSRVVILRRNSLFFSATSICASDTWRHAWPGQWGCWCHACCNFTVLIL